MHPGRLANLSSRLRVYVGERQPSLGRLAKDRLTTLRRVAFARARQLAAKSCHALCGRGRGMGETRPGHYSSGFRPPRPRWTNARQQLERLANGLGFSSRAKPPSPRNFTRVDLKNYEREEPPAAKA
jgi:hypothetical protein